MCKCTGQMSRVDWTGTPLAVQCTHTCSCLAEGSQAEPRPCLSHRSCLLSPSTPRRLTKKQLSAWVHVAPPGQYEEIWFRGGHT